LRGINKKVAEGRRCPVLDVFLRIKHWNTQVDTLFIPFLDAGAVPAASTSVVRAELLDKQESVVVLPADRKGCRGR